MNPEFWAAVAGAIVGAIAGGGITWALQWHQDVRQTRERNRALARSLIFKLMRIHDDFDGFRRHVEDCLANAESERLPDGWKSLRGVANLPLKLAFTPEEMSYLLSLRDFDLFNKVISLDVLHSATIGIFELYGARRMALLDMLPASMRGSIGTAAIDAEQFAFYAPRATELDLLAADIKGRVDDDVKDSREALLKAAVAVTSTLGQPLKLEIPSTQDSTATPR